MPQPIPSSPSKASPLPIPRSGDTRTRILQAAERLFAECGFEGASMRALARAAGASLSSTN
ncbi:MAG: TetR/AcrR family transcriptional regulator, partial [bacterium]